MKSIYIILFLLVASVCKAQVRQDSLVRVDSARVDSVKVDSLRADSLKIIQDTVSRDSILQLELMRINRRMDSLAYAAHPYFRFTKPVKVIAVKKQWEGKEMIFYTIILLFIFFALIKNSFHRYLTDLFRIFFRTTLKQRQIKEQLMFAPAASFLFNILFLLSGSLFICLLLRHFNLGSDFSFWVLYLYCFAGLASIYLIKFVSLKLFGWMLAISEATDTYIFIVFTANKILGIILLPFLLGLAFAQDLVYEIAFSISLTMVAVLFIYRYFLSYISVNKLIRINFFHFFIYLCAFEIAPLLLINKLLVQFFSETY